MPIVQQWCDQGEPIYFMIFLKDWTEADFYAAIDRAAQETLHTCPPMFTGIADLSQSTSAPVRLFTLGLYGMKHAHPQMRLIILAGASPFMRRLIGAGMKLYNHKGVPVRFCDTVEEARTMSRRFLAAFSAEARTGRTASGPLR
jgi:hypothetical protein